MRLSPSGRPDDRFAARIADGVAAVDASAWGSVAGGANPFVSHAFLAALEESGSVSAHAGWQPAPILVEDGGGALAGALPAYLKSHSQGEYVFDHSWADAWMRAGGRYYPKLQIAAPFSPVPGPRVLTRDPDIAPILLQAAQALVVNNGLSSAHATFVEEAQRGWFEDAGWLLREGVQYHWFNRGYASFDDFLGALSSRKRKTIRKERAAAQAAVTIRAIEGADITESDWDAFWVFYQDTGARKWGRPYLTRAFFSLIGQSMADRLLLFVAEQEGEPIAGALNLIGADFTGAIGAAPATCRSCISSSAIIRRSRRRSRAASAGSRRARRANTSSPEAMFRCRPGRRTTSPIPAFAMRSRTF
jgi:predicted N-acyltransferase